MLPICVRSSRSKKTQSHKRSAGAEGARAPFVRAAAGRPVCFVRGERAHADRDYFLGFGLAFLEYPPGRVRRLGVFLKHFLSIPPAGWKLRPARRSIFRVFFGGAPKCAAGAFLEDFLGIPGS